MIASLPLLAWPVHRQVLTTLIYHRVLAAPDPLRNGEVVADVFEDQMRFLSRHFAVLPLLEAATLLQRGRLPRRACCITFDDGYADNLTVAAPILRHHDLPATVFVASGYLDGQRLFNDSVIDAIARSEHPQLDLRDIGLGVHRLETSRDRQTAVTSILRQFRRRPPETRANDLATLLELAACGPLPADTMLSRDQVRELAAGGIEIGGHTVTHPILTSVDDERARHEIAMGRQQLEEISGQRVRVFAYPNGVPQKDFAERHVAMVKDAGFDVAVTTARGVGCRDSDVLQLPRFAPWGASERRWAVQVTRNAWIGRATAIC